MVLKIGRYPSNELEIMNKGILKAIVIFYFLTAGIESVVAQDNQKQKSENKVKNKLVAKETIEINAPANKVWTIITDSASVSKFMMGMKPITDWKVRSVMNWIGRHENQEQNMAKGNIQELVINKKLQYSFFFPGYGHADIPEHYQTVILELVKVNDSVTILYAQQGDFSVFAEGETYIKHARDFWHQAVVKIKELSEL